jgi:murein DD-endopeptidase MepM/ murein hydrolase activator NlpD
MNTYKLVFLLLTGICLVQCTKQEPPGPAAMQPDSVRTASIISVRSLLDDFGIKRHKYTIRDFKVQKNESLYVLLTKLGFTPQQIYHIAQKAKDIIDPKAFRPGQPYRAYFSKKNHAVKKLVWQLNDLDYVTFNWQADSLQIYRASRIETQKVKTIHGVIHSSLYDAVSDDESRAKLVYELTNIMAWQIDFTTLRPGDTFKMVYEKNYVDGRFYDTGKILAITLKNLGKTYRVYHFRDGKFDGYFNAKGHSVQKALLKTPFKYDERISSRFNPHRMNPVLHRVMPHKGVDYAAPYGTPVLSTGKGTVLEAHYVGAAGNIVKIRHNKTFVTAYMHLSKFASGIHRGVHVNQGQVIGYVGATGRVTGTNLHYGVFKNGRAVNPLTLDLPSAKSIPKKLMPAFKKTMAGLNKKLFGG